MKMTKLERRWARAVFDAIIPAGSDPDLPDGILDHDLDGYLDDVAENFPAASYAALRVTVGLIALSPPLALGRLCTIVGLAAEDRERLMEKLYASPVYFIRQLIIMIKALGSIHYFSHVDVRRGLRRPVDLVSLRKAAASPANDVRAGAA